jgi:hypothetical protein
MSAADQLRYNTSVLAPLLLQGPSLWQYSAWAQCANYIDRRIDISPVEADNYGVAGTSGWNAVTLTFIPPKIADRAGECQFMGQVSGLQWSGSSTGTGTFLAVVDGFGFYVWQSSTVVNGQNTLQYFKSEDAYDEYASMYKTEERDAIAYLTQSELSLVERQSLVGANVSFNFWADMPYYWTYTLDRNLCLFQQALEHRITVMLNPTSKLIESDGTAATAIPTGLISGLRMRILYTHTQAPERDQLTTDIRTGMGLVWKIKDIQRTTITVPASSYGQQLYSLSAITGDVTTLCFMMRVQSEIDGTTLLNRPFSNLQAIPKLRILSNGGDEIYPWVEGDYLLYHVHRKAGYPAPAGKRIYRINFERYPAGGPNSFSGERYFGNINNPNLQIDWGNQNASTNSPNVQCQIYVKAIIVNYIQHSNGEVSRVIPNN